MEQKKDIEPKLKTDIGLISALSIVVGVVLGAGAFMKPPAVMAAAGDSTWALGAWVIGAVFSMAGGLTLCELGVLYPRTGGVYVFLEEIYGPKVAYLYGWMLTFIFGPATLGALAGYFSSVFCLLFDIPNHYAGVVGLSAMAFVLFVNSVSVKQAGHLQVVATFCKLIPIILLAVVGLWKGNGHVLSVSTYTASATSFSVAVIATLFAYDGWAQVASVAGEMKNPGKILPRAIIGGLIFLSIIYIVINIAMLKVLSPAQMVALGHDASSIAAQKLFGLYGGNLVSVGIMISIIGGLNGYIMTLSRIVLTMAERNQLPGSGTLCKIEEDSKTPVNAALLLTVLAFIYLRVLDADRLTDMAMFAIWIFYMLSFIAVFIARRRLPDEPRSYKVPFYPVTPLIAIGGALYIMYGMAISQPINAAVSIGLTLAGLPILYLITHRLPRFQGFAVSKKYVVLAGSILVIGALVVSPQIIDTRPVLRVAIETSNPPIAFEDETGKPAGLDVEVIQAVAHEMGYRVSFRPTAFSLIFLSVEKDLADVAISELTVTEERKKLITFTKSYHKSSLALLVRPDSKAGKLDDLKGKAIGVKSSTTGEIFMEKHPGYTVRRMTISPDLAGLFNSGGVDAVVFDKPVIEEWLSKRIVTGRMVPLGDQEEYAIAYRKENAELGRKLDKAVDVLFKSGKLEIIIHKWLNNHRLEGLSS
ncbi:MAG: Putrescine transporter PotE [Syntrophus sp. SKADARSKE-3]|nr:Putrescine transporter PotE [Syntrophus sp. SKADARSKE-3]